MQNVSGFDSVVVDNRTIGNINLTDNFAATNVIVVGGNQADGNIDFIGNMAGFRTASRDNVVGGNLTCFENSPAPLVLRNTVAGNSDC